MREGMCVHTYQYMAAHIHGRLIGAIRRLTLPVPGWGIHTSVYIHRLLLVPD